MQEKFPLGATTTGFVAGTVSYVGDRLGPFASSGDPAHFRQDYPSYTQTDLRFGVYQGLWTVNLFVTNITDRRGLISGGPALGRPGFITNQPRTSGVTLSRNF